MSSRSLVSTCSATASPLATILVVDDTAEVLEVTASILEDAGYAALRCRGSREALAVLKDGPAIDLLLTDVTMPGEIDGFELAREVRVMRPMLPIAYITGYFHLQPNDMGELLGPILRKPYRRDDLTRQIKGLLAGSEDAHRCTQARWK
jgi:CheY-like chemotaxis protein